jgi:hypothetical protein
MIHSNLAGILNAHRLWASLQYLPLPGFSSTWRPLAPYPYNPTINITSQIPNPQKD